MTNRTTIDIDDGYVVALSIWPVKELSAQPRPHIQSRCLCQWRYGFRSRCRATLAAYQPHGLAHGVRSQDSAVLLLNYVRVLGWDRRASTPKPDRNPFARPSR